MDSNTILLQLQQNFQPGETRFDDSCPFRSGHRHMFHLNRRNKSIYYFGDAAHSAGLVTPFPRLI